MRLKITTTLLVILLGLLIYIFYIDQWGEGEQQEIEQSPLGEFTADTDYISIENKRTKAKIELRKEDQRWTLVAPYRWPANEFAVERILTQLRFINAKTSFEVALLSQADASLEDYGLAPPDLTLKFGRGESINRIGIGKATDIGNHLYILSPDREYIHVVDRSLLDSLVIDSNDLRDKRIFSSGMFEVKSWNLQTKDSNNLRTRLSRQDKYWTFETPFRAFADAPAVNTTLNSILTLQASTILNGNLDLSDLGLQTPDFRIAIETDQNREVLEIGQLSESEEHVGMRYAKLVERDTVFLVKLDLEDLLLNAQTRLRDRHILTVDPRFATSIVIQEDDAQPLTLQKLENDQWELLVRDSSQGIVSTSGDKQAISEAIDWLDNLKAVPETGFVNDVPSAQDLENYGLEVPNYKITVSSSKSRNSDELLSTPITETIHIGDRNLGNRLERYVKLEQADFVYLIYNDALDKLHPDSTLYRDRTLVTVPSNSFVSLIRIEDANSNQTLFEERFSNKGEAKANALARQLVSLRADSILEDRYVESVRVANRDQAWHYRLIIESEQEQNQNGEPLRLEIMISDLTGGPLLAGAIKEKNITFRFPIPFIDEFSKITFDREKRQDMPTEPFSDQPLETPTVQPAEPVPAQ